MSEVTHILKVIERGDPHAATQLLPLVYDELRRLAARKLKMERPGHTLEATALVHEAYLRLVGGNEVQHWKSRGHFFGAAAAAMRRILVENARRKSSQKRGAGRTRLDLDAAVPVIPKRSADLLALNEALDRLAGGRRRCGKVSQPSLLRRVDLAASGRSTRNLDAIRGPALGIRPRMAPAKPPRRVTLPARLAFA